MKAPFRFVPSFVSS